MDEIKIGACEFCDEFAGEGSRFRQIYGDRPKSRVVMESEKLVVIPTIGQLFTGSMLVVSRDHLETFASADEGVHEDLRDLLSRLSTTLSALGKPLVFEHGATRKSGSGCGIYHAHMHIIPVPAPVMFEIFLTRSAISAASMDEAFRRLQSSSNYFLCKDTFGRVAFCEDDGSSIFDSQFGRRTLASHFSLDDHWDWRSYTCREERLLSTLDHFGASLVS